MASWFAHDKESNSSIDEGSLKGVFFFASYPDEKGNLENNDLAVLSVTCSSDGVLDLEAYTEGKKFLSENTL